MQVTDKWTAKLRERVPEPQILLVPGHFFFGRVFETPPDLSSEEVQALIELSLEGVSPFPLDHLSWGYLHRKGDARAFCFSTATSRLKEFLGDLDLHQFLYAFPGFLTQYGVTFDRPTVRFLAQNGSVSALVYEARDPQPRQIVSRAIRGELLSPEAALEVRHQLCQQLSAELRERAEEGVWVGQGYSFDEADHPVFEHCHYTALGAGTVEFHRPALTGDHVWLADLRDDIFQLRERRNRAISRRLWWGVKILGACAVLLLALQFLHWGMLGWNYYRAQQIAAQRDTAQRIDESDRLAARISEAVERSLQPIRMLEIVNAVRPDPVYFKRTKSEVYNQLEVEGESSQGIPTVNLYAAALQRLPTIEAVTQSAETRNGKTSFEMTITFTDEALIVPPAAEPEPETTVEGATETAASD